MQETKSNLNKEGVKYDAGKIPMDLVSPYFIEGVAKVLQFGAVKYKAFNWAKGMDYSRLYSALQRHTQAWYKGEDNDPETGYPHLYHAACCLMFLSEYQRIGLFKHDDRYNRSVLNSLYPIGDIRIPESIPTAERNSQGIEACPYSQLSDGDM